MPLNFVLGSKQSQLFALSLPIKCSNAASAIAASAEDLSESAVVTIRLMSATKTNPLIVEQLNDFMIILVKLSLYVFAVSISPNFLTGLETIRNE